MASVKIREVELGAGRTKIIVPITGRSNAAVLASFAQLGAMPEVDLVEWRVDYLPEATDAAAIALLSREAAPLLHGKPLLLTFRTKAEGGETAISDADYGLFCETVLRDGHVDLIDLELVRDAAMLRAVIAVARQQKVAVVLSNHDFGGTPPATELVRRLRAMQELGADIIKIAVMPRDAGDVLALLQATWEMRSQHGAGPMITMAMGGTGVVTRLAGEVFGSAATFGMLGEASAPGQVPVGELQPVLELIHGALPPNTAR